VERGGRQIIRTSKIILLVKNPGDVFALEHAKLRGQSGEARTNLYQPNRCKYHEAGKNPGDVVDLVESTKYKRKKELRQDQRLGGNVGLAEFRERCRELQAVEGHSMGKNPGDTLQANTVRHKSWMSSPGHPYTHSYTGKPLNPGDFWEIRPKPFLGAHFAVYPEALCVRPILSSCPLEVCIKCGKPRHPIIQTNNPGGILGKPGQPQVVKGKVYLLPDGTRSKGGSVYYSGKTIGWSSCDCNAGFEPGVVLDPFLGSGTTMKVALELGRNAIGIELNPKYVEIKGKECLR